MVAARIRRSVLIPAISCIQPYERLSTIFIPAGAERIEMTTRMWSEMWASERNTFWALIRKRRWS
jgi:hypothetical protein